MKIVLLGYMGSGKSTIGKKLARKRDLPFLDLDAFITRETELSIPEIFREYGEIYFRNTEHQELKKILDNPRDCVLALGGGTPCYSGNMEMILSQTPHVFYLSLSIPELVARLSPEKANRPLISKIDDEELNVFIGKHLFERRPYYTQATHTIDCDGLEVDEIVREIEARLN